MNVGSYYHERDFQTTFSWGKYHLKCRIFPFPNIRPEGAFKRWCFIAICYGTPGMMLPPGAGMMESLLALKRKHLAARTRYFGWA